MATIYNNDGTVYREVKNLGWLLKNWQNVESLHFVHYQQQCGKMTPDGYFCADMKDGKLYMTDFASFDVWKRWINRPVFRGLDCEVRGIHGAV